MIPQTQSVGVIEVRDRRDTRFDCYFAQDIRRFVAELDVALRERSYEGMVTVDLVVDLVAEQFGLEVVRESENGSRDGQQTAVFQGAHLYRL